MQPHIAYRHSRNREVKSVSILKTLDVSTDEFKTSLFPECPLAGIVLSIEGEGQTIPRRAVIGIFHDPS